MRSRRHRKYRKIEVVDNKVNLVDIKTNRISRGLQVLRYQYDEDMNFLAKGLFFFGLLVVFLIVMVILITLRLWDVGVIG